MLCNLFHPPRGKIGAVLLELISRFVFSAVQRMAQAHLASLDMSSVDKEDPSSGEDEGEHEKESQQTASATGRSDRTVFHIMLAFVPHIDIAYTFQISFLSDIREESRPLREQCAPPDSLTGCADLSRHQGDKEEAKKREEGKGE